MRIICIMMKREKVIPQILFIELEEHRQVANSGHNIIGKQSSKTYVEKPKHQNLVLKIAPNPIPQQHNYHLFYFIFIHSPYFFKLILINAR